MTHLFDRLERIREAVELRREVDALAVKVAELEGIRKDRDEFRNATGALAKRLSKLEGAIITLRHSALRCVWDLEHTRDARQLPEIISDLMSALEDTHSLVPPEGET